MSARAWGWPRCDRAGEDRAWAWESYCGASAPDGKDRGMTDSVPVSQEDGPAARGTARAAGAVSGAPGQSIDPTVPGTAFPRTQHVLMLEFGDRRDFDNPRKEWRLF